MFAGLARDPDCYGLLRPREDSALSVKSVSRDTALLLLTMQTSSTVPDYVIASLGEQFDSVIGQMILDGILEIESGDALISGPAARELVCGKDTPPAPKGALATLSHRAMEYADALDIADPAALSGRLYAYNRVPASDRWRNRLPNASAVESYLGIRNGDAARTFERGWTRIPSAADVRGWIAWQSRRTTPLLAGSATYKLYVSPACSDIPEAFAVAAEVLSQSVALHFKVGNDAYGLLRPDKIVAHFASFADVQATAGELLERLAGCPAQGVPFTAEIAPSGLLSWGIDPPLEERSVAWLERESWRARICNRLATALALAKTSAGDVSAPQFAMERLRLEGIDTGTWEPTSALAWAPGSADR